MGMTLASAETLIDGRIEATHIPPGETNILVDPSPQTGKREGLESNHPGEENQGTDDSPDRDIRPHFLEAKSSGKLTQSSGDLTSAATPGTPKGITQGKQKTHQ